MDDLDVIACSVCKTIYEIERHHVRPAFEPKCEACGHDLPIAEGDKWLTYKRIRPKAESDAGHS